MKLVLVALVLLMAVAWEQVAARSHSNLLAWRQFKQEHGKVYVNQQEDARRFANFLARKVLIDRHNENTSLSYTLGLNHMSDWTSEERASLNGVKPPAVPQDVAEISEDELAKILGDGPIPDEVDWRKVKDRVSSVKDQKRCGSCWAFATAGMLEGQEIAQNMSSLVDLSEEEIVACSASNDGCLGGWMSRALDDLAGPIGGIESESDYPYTGRHGETCHADKSKFLPLKVKGHKMLPGGDETTLKRVVANYGPVSIALDASDSMMDYKSGIFIDHQECQQKNANHAMLVVGYGKDPMEGEYWIIKNSWTTKWGEQGYIRFRAGENMCGIADFGTLATF